jgi:hypothetical protein
VRSAAQRCRAPSTCRAMARCGQQRRCSNTNGQCLADSTRTSPAFSPATIWPSSAVAPGGIDAKPRICDVRECPVCGCHDGSVQRATLGGILGLEIFSLRERPDLRPLDFGSDLQSVWPEFMRHSAAARLYFAPWIFDRYLDHAFAGVTDGKVVARALCVPFAINTEGRTELPDHGWDQVIRWAHDDGMIGRARML